MGEGKQIVFENDWMSDDVYDKVSTLIDEWPDWKRNYYDEVIVAGGNREVVVD